MKSFADNLAVLALTLWVGALFAIGYIAAPVLFASLDNKMLAGSVAGRMFDWVGYIGLFSGFYLLILQLYYQGLVVFKRATFWLVLFMLLITIGIQFGIAPLLASFKAQAWPHDVMATAFRDRFVAWHGISSIIYLVETVLGLWLVSVWRR